MRFMRAAVYRSYGPPDVLKIEDVEQPSIQGAGDDRVLIKVHSASVNVHDYLHRKGYFLSDYRTASYDPGNKYWA